MTIELSLASPMFRDLGPEACEVLGVVAFFLQGVNEENTDWLFPTISDGPRMFDTFFILSLTYRSDGFVTMLAPLREYLRPKDLMSSPLLGTTKECYFSRLPVNLNPTEPGFEESQQIMSEDVNVEHLVDVFTSIDANSENVWRALLDLWDTSVGINRGSSCWDQRSRHSQMTTPPRHYVWKDSHNCSGWLEILQNKSGSSLTP